MNNSYQKNEEVSKWKTHTKEHMETRHFDNHRGLIDKDLHESQNISVFHMLFNMCLSTGNLFIFFNNSYLISFLFLHNRMVRNMVLIWIWYGSQFYSLNQITFLTLAKSSLSITKDWKTSKDTFIYFWCSFYVTVSL